MKTTLMILSLILAVGVGSDARAGAAQGAGLSRKAIKSLVRKTSFIETWSRYPAPDAIIAGFRNGFQGASSMQVGVDCKILTDNNRSLLGDSDPLTGAPAVDHPNSTFVNWYTNCLASYIKSEDQGLTGWVYTKQPDGSMSANQKNMKIEEFRRFFSSAVIDECLKNDDPYGSLKDPTGTVNVSSFTCRWTSLSAEVKSGFARQLLEKFIGPEEVILDLELAESENALAAVMIDEVDGFNAKPDNRFQMLGVTSAGNGALTVRDAAKILKFLINLEDTLKY